MIDNLKLQFAFFWVGNDISIPLALVNSIRFTYGDEAYIYQLSDKKTESIKDVNEIIRDELPNEIMLARLKAYSLIKTQNTTLFLDADSLVIQKLKLPDFNKYRACLVKRDDDTSILNHNYPEYYPEFFNQKIVDIMPILFGLIVTPDGGKLFDELFKNALKLPDRFHRWYGDQMAMAQEWIKNKENYLLLKQEEYLFITRTSLKKAQLEDLMKNGVKIITFKGPHSKQFIPETLKELVNE
ncbi:MAG: hypothetical protein FJX80_08200 [Bacteroidetes bacterium]|nr:hypothetical protein [Bacteroidota bacterium]